MSFINQYISLEDYIAEGDESGAYDQTQEELQELESGMTQDQSDIETGLDHIGRLQTTVTALEEADGTVSQESHRAMRHIALVSLGLASETSSLESISLEEDEAEKQGFFKKMWEALKKFFKAVWEKISNFFKKLWNFIRGKGFQLEKEAKEVEKLVDEVVKDTEQQQVVEEVAKEVTNEVKDIDKKINEEENKVIKAREENQKIDEEEATSNEPVSESASEPPVAKTVVPEETKKEIKEETKKVLEEAKAKVEKATESKPAKEKKKIEKAFNAIEYIVEHGINLHLELIDNIPGGIFYSSAFPKSIENSYKLEEKFLLDFKKVIEEFKNIIKNDKQTDRKELLSFTIDVPLWEEKGTTLATSKRVLRRKLGEYDNVNISLNFKDTFLTNLDSYRESNYGTFIINKISTSQNIKEIKDVVKKYLTTFNSLANLIKKNSDRCDNIFNTITVLDDNTINSINNTDLAKDVKSVNQGFVNLLILNYQGMVDCGKVISDFCSQYINLYKNTLSKLA